MISNCSTVLCMPGNTKDVSLLSKSVLKSSELSASENIQNVFNEMQMTVLSFAWLVL